MEFINVKWISPLYKKLKKISGNRRQQIGEIAEIFGDPVLLAKYYVEPNVQHWNPADLDEEQVGGRSALIMPAFQAFNDFLDGDVIQKRGQNQTFVQSDAGMGKSSMLVMLKTMELMSFWPRGYRCELFKIDSDTINKVSRLRNREKIVLLLDALDEDLDSRETIEQRVSDLLVVTRNFYRVIITCRTQYFPEGKDGPFRNPGRITMSGYTCPVWYLSPFDDKTLRKYIDKKYAKRWFSFKSNAVGKQQALQMVDKMGSLRFRPFLASHLDELVAANHTEIGCEADIYDALIEVWLDREIAKLLERGVTGQPIVNADLRKACRNIAVEMFLHGRQNIEPEKLQSMAIREPAIGYLENFDFGGRSLLNRDSDRRYRFSHKSIQEFLIAESLALGYRSSEIISNNYVGNVTEKFYWQLFSSLRSRELRKFQQWPMCFYDVLPASKLLGMSVGKANEMFVSISDTIAAIVGVRNDSGAFPIPVDTDVKITATTRLFMYLSPEAQPSFFELYGLSHGSAGSIDARTGKRSRTREDRNSVRGARLAGADLVFRAADGLSHDPKILARVQDEYLRGTTPYIQRRASGE
jgi:hypothetical protein